MTRWLAATILAALILCGLSPDEANAQAKTGLCVYIKTVDAQGVERTSCQDVTTTFPLPTAPAGTTGGGGAPPVTTSPLSTAPITFSTAGDNTIVTRVTGTIKVYRLSFTCASAVTVTVKNGSGTTLSGAMTGITSWYSPYESGVPHYSTTGTNNFVVNLGTAVACSGTVWYLDN